MKFYISGKIGEEVLSERTRQKFADAEDFLRSRGHEVFNPTCSGLGHVAMRMNKCNGEGFYNNILRLDLAELFVCDAVLVLPDWRHSPGAKAEVTVARAIGLPIYEKAPNGRLFEIEVDTVMRKTFGNVESTMSAGALKEVLKNVPDEMPVVLSSELMLGAPYEQSFDRELHGPVYEAVTYTDIGRHI